MDYSDYPAVEWIAYIKNVGSIASPVFREIKGCDFVTDSSASGEFNVYYSRGSHSDTGPSASVIDFGPCEGAIPVNTTLTFEPKDGCSSARRMPFFNLEKPDGTGILMATGWTGQWKAAFTRDGSSHITVQSGVDWDYLNLFLYAGERIRTPSTLLVFWDGGDYLRGHQQFRRLLRAHYIPDVEPPIAASPGLTVALEASSEQNMIEGINTVAGQNMPVDTWWLDAGWYPCNGDWINTGSWWPDPARYTAFPDDAYYGMRNVATTAHNHYMKFLLWFEYERARPGSWLYDRHRDWLLSDGTDDYLLDLGNPDALAWAKNDLSFMVGSIGVDVFRIDFNREAKNHWRHDESFNRRGITEIKYVMGMYEFLDHLLSEHPGLLIDNCAGGGRRLDLEMFRRSLALWRTDYAYGWDPIGNQSMTYGLSFWMPVTGVGAIEVNPYPFRSGMGSHMAIMWDWYDTNALTYTLGRQRLNNYLTVKHLFCGDYYPLTPYSTADDVWIAWQYDRPELGEGMLQAFRRDTNPTATMTFRLRGLDPTADYTLTNWDNPATIVMSGRDLMNYGLPITINSQPGAAVIVYHKN